LAIPTTLFAGQNLYRHYRWTHSGRSLIRIFDVGNNLERSFYPEYKAFAPSISSDEQYVAAVEVDFENQYYLSVYNALTGTLVTRYQTPHNNYLFNPVWIDGNTLAVIALTNQGKQLAVINPFDGTMQMLAETNGTEIKQLVYRNNRLYFVGGYSGQDELWQYSFSDHSISRIAKARFGHAYPAPDKAGNYILISDYTANGYQLISLKTADLQLEKISTVSRGVYPLAEILAKQEPGIVDFQSADTIRYHSAKYKKAANLFSFHSHAPFVLKVPSFEINPGVSILSQNSLGTAETTVGYKWNSSESKGRYFVNFEYKGWYPIVKLDASTGKRQSEYYEIQIFRNAQGNVIKQDTLLRQFTWNENDISIGGRVPLNFSGGAWFRLFQPEINYKLTRYNHHSTTPAQFIHGDMHTIAYRLYYHQIRRQAIRDLLPEYGWVSDLSFRNSPYGQNKVGSLLSGQLRLYLPGLASTHGTTVYAGIQHRNRGDKYAFSDVIRMPRGWPAMSHNTLSVLSLEYRLPLFYPEVNLGRYLYVRRVKAAVFGDVAQVRGDVYKNQQIVGQFNRNISSIGVDLTADINVLRLYAPADAGIRTIFLPETRNFRFEFLFSIDFTSF
jgi:hypothetical protein